MSALALTITFDIDGHNIRVVGTQDAPEFIAVDLCAALDLRGPNPWKHLPHDCKGKHSALTPGGWQKVITVTEQGFYRLVSVSRVPKAEEFRRKVFGEVLPCIRRFGCYPEPAQPALPPAPANALAVFEAAVAALREQAERTARVEAAQAEQGARLARIEARADVAETELRALPPAPTAAPEKSARAALNERVRSWGIANGGAFAEAWRKLKRELYYRASFDAEARAKHQGIPWLDVVEREGQMSTLYAIAAEVLR